MDAAMLLVFSVILKVAFGDHVQVSNGQDQLRLQGDFTIAGLFSLHYTDGPRDGLPALGPCSDGRENKHGYHLLQSMRFAVEEINNSSGPQSLLPGVKLGYQLYDTCTMPASVLATLEILEEHFHSESESGEEDDFIQNQTAVAVIGPDSSSKSFTPASLLGAYLIPQISYQASNEMLSNKFLYPGFFRTIPSDKNQVKAMIQLLVRFNWTWIALLGSDNSYGLAGMQSLYEQAEDYGICVAFRGIIPSNKPEAATVMKNLVEGILRAKVNTIVLFSSKSKLSGFIPFVVERNVTGKVWIGTEDWSVSTMISGIPGVQTIGTVLGVSIKYAALDGFHQYEQKLVKTSMEYSNKDSEENCCLQSVNLWSLSRKNFSLEEYDVTSASNVYKAVYAVAHALHKTLDCDSGQCQMRRVLPWQLLSSLKQVRFSLDNTSVYFDSNGDPPTGYDIITWIWSGHDWTYRTVGSFSPDPIRLTIDADRIEWHTASSKTVPKSLCSPPCPKGHRKLLLGHHACCFDCQACAAATFLNTSDPTTCQRCPPQQWSPESSEECLDRTILLLAWDAPLSIALLFFLTCCVLLTTSSAIILFINLNTPVAKSAGGRTCLLMLAALTAAAMSSLTHFGQPSPLACILKQPLFIFSFTVCLACITVRALQVLCIFKFAAKLPPAYDKWTKNHGPELTILVVSVIILIISVLRVAIDPPEPSQDLHFYHDSIVLECSNTLSPGSGLELGYVSLLSVLCFTFSYMGKDLPANYNEAKCVAFSLMVYMISWISFFTLYFISRGTFTMAAYVFAILFSVLAVLGGYFFPKMYIIVLRPDLNTTAHFQNCIQMYTMTKQ